MWSPIGRAVVELIPVRLQVSLASRVDDELCNALLTREPVADNLTSTILVQDEGSDVFSGSWLVVPSGSAVDQLRINTGDVDGEGGFAFEADGWVLGFVGVDVEVYVTERVAVIGNVEVDGCPLLIISLALAMMLVCAWFWSSEGGIRVRRS